MKDFILPYKALENLSVSDVNTAFVCSSLLYQKELGGIMFICDDDLFEKIEYKSKNSKDSPEHKIRIITRTRLEGFPEFVFEFEIIFKNIMVLKAHLNPREKAFRNLCLLTIKSKMMSIHFENITSRKTISLHFPLDEDDDLDWFQRNLEKSKQIKSNTFFNSLSNFVIESNENINTYYFVQHKKIKFIGV